MAAAHATACFAGAFLPPRGLARRGEHTPLRCAVRARGTGTRMGAGFGGLLRRGAAGAGGRGELALPRADAACACGRGAAYGQCCRVFHTGQRLPRLAEELLRARYAAYAYALPAFIMRTTMASEQELDRRRWRAEIAAFCAAYQFAGGVDVLDTNMTGPHSTTIVFRANMQKRGEEVSFVERSKFEKIKGTWFYASGKLIEVEGRINN